MVTSLEWQDIFFPAISNRKNCTQESISEPNGARAMGWGDLQQAIINARYFSTYNVLEGVLFRQSAWLANWNAVNCAAINVWINFSALWHEMWNSVSFAGGQVSGGPVELRPGQREPNAASLAFVVRERIQNRIDSEEHRPMHFSHMAVGA
jgi:hypothetical protein